MFKYEAVSTWIREQIDNGTNQPGTKLPTERELMERFSVSRQSVRRALQDLEQDGLIISIQGSGIYVADRGQNGVRQGALPFTGESRHIDSRQIALVLTDHDDYIFPQIISGIYEVLEDAGFIINLFFTDNHCLKETHVLQALLEGSYAGLLLSGTQSAFPRPDDALFRQVIHRIPCIMMDSRYSGYGLPCVSLDDSMGGYVATRHLIENGHRKIAYIGRSEYRQGIKRGQGYVRALQEAGIEVDYNHVFFYTLDTYPLLFQRGVNREICSMLEDCTAVTCYNDQLAYDLIRMLELYGMRVPDDISIIGYDNAKIPPATMKISTLEHPKNLLGKKAAENLLRLIRDPSFEANYSFPPTLIRGETVRNIQT